MTARISSVNVYVNSQAEAKSFWVDKFGLVVKSEYPLDDQGHLWLEVGAPGDGTTLVLYDKALMRAQMPGLDLAHPGIRFYSDDPQALHEALKARGVTATPVKNDPFGTWFQFRDQDNNPYMVLKPAK
ncbi:MAG: VOC family protein [Anaerolineae bacterium]